MEGRFKKAAAAVDALLVTRRRSREAAVWQTLAARERLCEELDRAVQAGGDATAGEAAIAAAREQWAKLPEVSAGWEKQMTARRDAASRAIGETALAGKHAATIERNAVARREILLELELLLGLDSPAALQTQRLALQVRQLKDRFSSAVTASAETAGERLLAWCALAGGADALDRQRCERIIARVGDARSTS